MGGARGPTSTASRLSIPLDCDLGSFSGDTHTITQTPGKSKPMNYSGGGILKPICVAMQISLAAGVQAITGTGRQYEAGPDLGDRAQVPRLPRGTGKDKGSRLTLSPAVPPDWMHSIQSPGGQITGLNPRECHMSASDCLRDAGG